MAISTLRHPPNAALDKLDAKRMAITGALAAIKAAQQANAPLPPPGATATAGPMPSMGTGAGTFPGMDMGAGLPPPPGATAASSPLATPAGLGAGPPATLLGLPPGPAGVGMGAGLGATAPPPAPLGGAGMGVGTSPMSAVPPPMGGLAPPAMPPRMAAGGVVGTDGAGMDPATALMQRLAGELVTADQAVVALTLLDAQGGATEPRSGRMAAGGLVASTPAHVPQHFLDLLAGADDEGDLVAEMRAEYAEDPSRAAGLWSLVQQLGKNPALREDLPDVLRGPRKAKRKVA